MTVTVQYSGQLRSVAGCAEEVFSADAGCSLHQLLERVAAQRDGVARPHLFSESGGLRRSLLLVVNGRVVPAADAAQTTVQSGDIVSLMPPIAGG
jgi:sulfur-carrier protein